ncbi:MAG: hypothetical protein NTV79_11185 [Candidatus Aureabacteria bacterium]|nr:hypothetical protein [Candidatus Auribacterota bacterium]
MKKLAPALALFILAAPPAWPAEGKAPAPAVALGGGAYLRYLHLDLSRWRTTGGGGLPDQDIAVSGGRVCAAGPIGPDTLRWRLGGFLDWGGTRGDRDVDELILGMAGAGLTAGLAWCPGPIGVSSEVNIGGDYILTEFKRAEFPEDWDLYERRDTALFRLEPILGLDIRVSSIFVIRVHGGYSFLWGRGEQVGGFTAGIAADFGKWM